MLVSPAFLKAEINAVMGKVIPIALARTAAKDIPVLGMFSGLGFGIWRIVNG